MKIIFRGDLSDIEAGEGFSSILSLFKERYGIEGFRDLKLSMTMLDMDGEEVELVDADTAQVFGTFEINKSGFITQSYDDEPEVPHLMLVVDNTKKEETDIVAEE